MNIILETESGIHLAPANQELALLNIKSYKNKKGGNFQHYRLHL